MFLMNVACNDPGAAIGGNLVLPILQERLDSLALDYAAEKAAEAEKAIIKMEVGLENPVAFACSLLQPHYRCLIHTPRDFCNSAV